MRVLGAMIILPIIVTMLITFILFNIFVAVIGIISLVLLIKKIKSKKKSVIQVVFSTIFIISGFILTIVWSFVLYPDFYGQRLSSMVVGKEIAAIEYRDTKSLEKYLKNGWIIDENQQTLIKNLILGEYSKYSDDIVECKKIDAEKAEILGLLLEYGYDENTTLDRERNPITLLTLATVERNTSAVSVLLKHGADVNDLKHEQGTILHKIFFRNPSNDTVEILKMFIEHDVDIYKINEKGITGKEHLQNQIKQIRENFENAEYTNLDEQVIKALEQVINDMN